MTQVYSNNLSYYIDITGTGTCGYNIHQTYLPDRALATACAIGKLIMETVISETGHWCYHIKGTLPCNNSEISLLRMCLVLIVMSTPLWPHKLQLLFVSYSSNHHHESSYRSPSLPTASIKTT